MARRDLLKELSSRPLLCDGAMGTQLMAQGLATGACGELWNVQKPDVVQSIHRAYRQAGCDLITTNTFGGCSEALQRHGASDRVAQLNQAGAQAARAAAGDEAFVLGDIGPFGGFVEPVGDMSVEKLTGIFQEQAAALKAGGADAAIVETMSDPAEMVVAIRAAKSVGDWPVIATYAFAHAEENSFRTMMGTSVEDALAAAIDAGANIVGANCGTQLSLEDYVRLAQALVAAAAGRVPVILQPNAGSPRLIDGKLIYAATPADMAQIVPALLAAGVRIIGGCCGTTPDHLRAIGQALPRR